MTTVEDSLLCKLADIHMRLARSAPRRSRHYTVILRTLERIEHCFMSPLRMAVLGESKSGKSLLINYLLKHQILPSGGFAGESTAILIRYAPEETVHSIGTDGSRNRLTSRALGQLVRPESPSNAKKTANFFDAIGKDSSNASPKSTPHLIFREDRNTKPAQRLIEVGLPLEFLKRVEIIELRDYPDSQADNPSHQAFRRVGVSIWCTLATQAWKETEVNSWNRLPEVNRRGSLILASYKDAIRNDRDEAKFIARLRHTTTKHFDDVALVSLRDAVQSLVSGTADEARRLRTRSNIDNAENAIISLVENWQVERLQKASRILGTAAWKLSLAAARDNRLPMCELAARLERLASEFCNAAPSMPLGSRAA